MAGRIQSVATWDRSSLADAWQAASSAPGAVDGPDGLARAGLDWVDATVPGTFASALREVGAWKLDGPPRRFDADDVVYRTKFRAGAPVPGERLVLGLEGLATYCDVWLNGAHVLSSESMFESHELDVSDQVGDDNDLILRFSSLDAALLKKRPRPRWRAPMIEHQQLRWHRTTLLGRTPGWSPPAAAVGPWRPMWLERRREVDVSELEIAARLEGGAGLVEISLRASKTDGAPVDFIEIVVARGEYKGRAGLSSEPGTDRWRGRLVVHPSDVEPWWPHTHGEPALYDVSLSVGDVRVELGAIGFRTLEVRRDDGDFSLEVGGAPIFCRGACWSPLDAVSLEADPKQIDAAVRDAKKLGMNMLRIPGTNVYESDAFYDACDREGVLVFQDLMFANMDYPGDDEAFASLARRETQKVLSRLAARPSLAVIAGNSEVEQQAAMWGAPRDAWAPPLFHDLLATVARRACPQAVYWPSSAHGGAFPHQPNVGTTSYYGVGAYLGPLEDARRSEVRFATECLAFSNVPEPQSIVAMPFGEAIRVHHAAWKARAPRDLGAGWDFEDVRDHYLKRLFGPEPAELRARDHERYLALSRVTTGEVMAATFSEWRRGRSKTRGALILFLRDLWLGAGWGVIDAAGTPKAAAHYLRRVLQPVFLGLSDEGHSGLSAHVTNERQAALDATLSVTLFHGTAEVAHASRELRLSARESIELSVAEMLEHLFDTTYAYRFGPPTHDLVHAVLEGPDDLLHEAFFFPTGRPSQSNAELGWSAEATSAGEDFTLTIRTRAFAQSVRIEGDGVTPDESYFHVAPGRHKTVRLRTTPKASRCTVQALNASSSLRVTLPR